MHDYTATAYGAALVGLAAKIITVRARKDDGHGVTHEGIREPSIDGWTRETLIRARAVLAVLGVDGVAFRIDPKPTPDARLDVAIVAACLGALGMLGGDVLGSTLFLGEFGLEGQVRPVRGVLPILSALKTRFPGAVVPRANWSEARESGLFVYDIEHARGIDGKLLARACIGPSAYRPAAPDVDLSGFDARTLRALEIAAAGGHGLYVVGHGRRHALASALRSLLPPMTVDEAVEATSLHSVAGLLKAGEGLLSARPLRAPHHSVSDAGLVGGGHPIRPGEASLAHHGVLLLDEAPEFRSTALDRLRHALQMGDVRIVRGENEVVMFPARPLLVLGSAPCGCGVPGDDHGERCSPERRAAYVARPLRFLAPFGDVRVDLPESAASMQQDQPRPTAAEIRARVEAARAFYREKVAVTALPMPRTSVERVARTIASLAGSLHVLPEHEAEARTFALGGA